MNAKKIMKFMAFAAIAVAFVWLIDLSTTKSQRGIIILATGLCLSLLMNARNIAFHCLVWLCAFILLSFLPSSGIHVLIIGLCAVYISGFGNSSKEEQLDEELAASLEKGVKKGTEEAQQYLSTPRATQSKEKKSLVMGKTEVILDDDEVTFKSGPTLVDKFVIISGIVCFGFVCAFWSWTVSLVVWSLSIFVMFVCREAALLSTTEISTGNWKNERYVAAASQPISLLQNICCYIKVWDVYQNGMLDHRKFDYRLCGELRDGGEVCLSSGIDLYDFEEFQQKFQTLAMILKDRMFIWGMDVGVKMDLEEQ
ncbi:hypothetical protein [Candidatus Uabimicrobium amorphum]|uniref:Uncharacterized protein n=1 Tax=Uabimicrobium amorphum TaxID=2596890 RepID=A0A5S9F426_UABAM|nr:hypothetical protein [Candidatus Uabimicrobium amorphum]BBM83772.1 hypothetical protein UABAM_02127 [Candidatus Uabimicrobium amorphum]